MHSFAELNLDPRLTRALTEMGIETPSPIQAQALPVLLGDPTDFIGLAATGTGKTAAFSLPMLSRLDPTQKRVQALILCPTRELAVQVANQIDLMGKYMNVRALPIYGGASYDTQINGIRRGAQVVVGTPGRVVDHMERGSLDLSSVQTVILDEADEMISMGFKEALELILSQVTREDAVRWLFSATMSREVRRVADAYLHEPAQAQVNQEERIPEAVEQYYYATSESNKPEVLCKLMDSAPDFYGIIFCQTKALVTDLTQYLKGRDYRVDCLHGDMDQKARERTMKAFREKNFSILVATDVACRGLDVKDLTHVINYSIPRELEHYVHRIGRTGRSGKAGLALSLVTPSHRGLIPRIERLTQRKMKEGRIPSRKEIGQLKIAAALSRFQDQPAFDRAVQLLSAEWKTALEGMTKEEIAGRFLAHQYPEVFSEQREEATARPARPMPTGVVIEVPTRAAAAPRAPQKFSAKQALIAPKKPVAEVKAVEEVAAVEPVVVAPVAFSAPVEAPAVVAAAEEAHQPMTLESLMAVAEAPVAKFAEEQADEVDVAPAVAAEAPVVAAPAPAKTFKRAKPAFEKSERPTPWGGPSKARYGEKPRFGGDDRGSRPPRFGGGAEKPRFGEEKPSFGGGDRPRFGAARPRFGADKPRFGGGERPRFGAAPRSEEPSASRYGAPRSGGYVPRGPEGDGYFAKPKRAKGSVNGPAARGSRW